MNEQQAENLRILIRHMEGLERTLHMNSFIHTDCVTLCQTPACALGEAMFHPALNARGLTRADKFNTGGLIPACGDDPDVRGTAFFGISYEDGNRLFGDFGQNAWMRCAVTPQEWATEARKVLAEHGYSMDAKPDAFQTFLASLTAPPAGDAQPELGEVLALYKSLA